MREKVTRILSLVLAGKLSLDDAATLLAALNTRLALSGSDRELLAALVERGELEAEQLTEHLLLLRRVRDLPRPPQPPHPPAFVGPWPSTGGVADMTVPVPDRVPQPGSEGVHPTGGNPARPATAARTLTLHVESASGAEYHANIPISLAPHLHRLIPPHGVRALEQAGFSLEALTLLLEADPPPGDLITAEDSNGNEVYIRLQ